MFGAFLVKMLTSALTKQVAAQVAVVVLEEAVSRTDNDIDDKIVGVVKGALNAKTLNIV